MFENFKDVLTAEDVCKALQMGRNTVYKLLQSKEIKSIKIGRKYFIPKEFLIDYIQQFKQSF